jgi:hypothetical protein
MSVEPQFSPHPDFGALFRPAFLQRGIVGQNTQDLVAVVNIESDEAKGSYLVKNVRISGDNYGGDWVCTSQVLRYKK